MHCVHVFSSLHYEQYAEHALHVEPLKYIPATHEAGFEHVPFTKV